MTLKISIILQCLGAFVQMVLPAAPGFPPEWKDFCHALVGWIQTVLGILAHISNTDGTTLVPPVKITLGAKGV